MAWISPTGFVDSDSGWVSETKIYDGSTLDADTGYTETIIGSTWSKFVELTHSAIGCTKVRFWAIYDPTLHDKIDIDAYYTGAWHNVYEGAYSDRAWIEKSLTEGQRITAFRFRFYAKVNTTAHLVEVEFYEEILTDPLSTQSPTDILPTTVTGNGKIAGYSGNNFTVRGFKYGLTKVNTWDVHDDGDYEEGTFTKGLTGLSANTTYWIRAYATNDLDTYYGEWLQFQTAALGIIPTGTQLFICSDYSGYTYQLMRAETDDGETYTGYFVVSTDLTEKKGLAFYKRILDLHLYFMSEDSGIATIEVKRDNEASWQSVGEISLVGTEDIIVKHLAPDIRAKVFLFKISATNMFRFLGVLFEYLPEDLR